MADAEAFLDCAMTVELMFTIVANLMALIRLGEIKVLVNRATQIVKRLDGHETENTTYTVRPLDQKPIAAAI